METKAVWDIESTEIFINACIEQIYKRERSGQTFTKKGWTNIIATFNQLTGKQYGKKQLKNKLDILRKDLKIWDSLLKETGVGRDPGTNNVVQTTEWWTQKIRENPGYKKFKNSCLKFENELRLIFKDVIASGEHMFSPTPAEPDANERQSDDVYRPTMDEEEGSGDSEDDQFGVNPAVSTGVTDELASFGLASARPSECGPSSSTGIQKRKRGEGPSMSKKKKVPAAQQLADAVSVIANVSVDRAAALTGSKETSIPEVMKHLMSLDEVKADKAFTARCMRALESKARREFFVSLIGQPDHLLVWLRLIAGEE